MEIGKSLMWIGGLLFLVGLCVWLQPRLPLLKQLGRLPGDFNWQGEGWRVHMPLATSLLFSVLLSLGLWLISWLSGRGGK
jgi:hypothetical protein